MTKKTVVKERVFTLWDDELDQKIMEFDITNPDEWEYWQQFLNDKNTKSFRFIGVVPELP